MATINHVNHNTLRIENPGELLQTYIITRLRGIERNHSLIHLDGIALLTALPRSMDDAFWHIVAILGWG